MRPLLPSCSPCCRHAATAAIMRPLSCGPCHHHAAPATVMQPLPPSSGASGDVKPGHTGSHCWPKATNFTARVTLSAVVLMADLLASDLLQQPAEAHEAWQPAGFVTHPAAPAAIMGPLLPSCGPCCRHAAPAAVIHPQPLSCGPLPPSCGSCCRHAAPATIIVSPCRYHAAPAPIRPLWLDCWSASSSTASAPAPLLTPLQPRPGGPL
jgi:hypothetical protein